ncbi:lysozyme inhibitor LprI family protein [Phytobacter diazotrophicus]|uniref:lysozyme inhibitor LprI family protein n=1 Tax=Phytobacter diazotrophicus TaxID=395631 RepID=UPI002FFC2157
MMNYEKGRIRAGYLKKIVKGRVMKKVLIAVAILAGMGVSTSLRAADCANPGASAEVDSCAIQGKDAAEQALNKAWSEARRRITTTYKAHDKEQKEYQQNLLDSQRGWLKYRDSQCKMQAFLAEEGTTAYDTLTNNCISDIDKQRIKQLKLIPYQ